MASRMNEYIRQVLHHSEAPPPVEARFFYTSPIPIDDPLSPLPPPATGAVLAPQAPKAFSRYDNTSLDNAWHELRRKILKYNEEHGEKDGLEFNRARKDSGSVRQGKRASGPSQPGTPRAKPVGRPAATSLSQVDGPQTDVETPLDLLDGPSLGLDAVSHETTGTPFIRAPNRRKQDTVHIQRGDERKARPKTLKPRDTYEWDDTSHAFERSPAPEEREPVKGPSDTVAVGVSRLHQVEMPDLKMTPIYWAPVHDTAAVMRGTWFYQDTMLPVETLVANMLEAGYIDLQVWTDTWRDELNSAVEVGAAGEMKIVHKLWPDKTQKPTGRARGDSSSSRPSTATRENLLRTVATNLAQLEPESPEQYREKCAEAACDIIDISTGPGGADNKATGPSTWGRQGAVRSYADCGVLYANDREARILKPSLLPSAYYGRRPLANYIRKGHKLGVPVVRGFNQAAWNRLHPHKSAPKAAKAEAGVSTSASGAPPNRRRKTDPDLAKSESPGVTDLIFVIHGIGQKLSQRMESFHFTHAINSFRREVNVEAGSKDIRARFRKDMGGIMVLPINWRHSLSFEEGGYRDEAADDLTANHFGLPDITPDTLPSVRNIVSDVMLDIPYYMSHHQPKMIAAVMHEANRVYQLWCVNNPGFAESGRVHIIAHSLGSVMAVDILSKQPTTIPNHLRDPARLNLSRPGSEEEIEHFLFQTSNLYLAGCPVGFFLLLKRAMLSPRIVDNNYEDDGSGSSSTAVCGQQGQYGCIPVENVYNFMNPYDPVSYHLNAAVDAGYASSLKKAFVPSAGASWFGGGGSGMSWFSGTGASNTRPSHPPLPRLPSNVEMETHNFSREEVAEKRMFLLNDNGQIDFFLRYGGGPLEIQYLTMLGAHSSYWLLRDFVRALVVETGRERGRDGTIPGMRAVKKKVQLT